VRTRRRIGLALLAGLLGGALGCNRQKPRLAPYSVIPCRHVHAAKTVQSTLKVATHPGGAVATVEICNASSADFALSPWELPGLSDVGDVPQLNVDVFMFDPPEVRYAGIRTDGASSHGPKIHPGHCLMFSFELSRAYILPRKTPLTVAYAFRNEAGDRIPSNTVTFRLE